MTVQVCLPWERNPLGRWAGRTTWPCTWAGAVSWSRRPAWWRSGPRSKKPRNTKVVSHKIPFSLKRYSSNKQCASRTLGPNNYLGMDGTLALSDTLLWNLMFSLLAPGTHCCCCFFCSSYCAEVLTIIWGRKAQIFMWQQIQNMWVWFRM